MFAAGAMKSMLVVTVDRHRFKDLKSQDFRARMILPSSLVAAATVFDIVPTLSHIVVH